MIEALTRWNRWGTARLDAGRPRDVTRTIGPFLETREVVGLIGPRRAGKSTVFFQIMDALEKKGVAPEAMSYTFYQGRPATKRRAVTTALALLRRTLLDSGSR